MDFGKDIIDFEGSMSEAVEDGASLAWRLLATLEGGSLILAASALLAYTARNKIVQRRRVRRPVRSVLVTNTNNLLGRELKTRFEERGCFVSTVPSGTPGDLTSRLDSDQFDALVVVGAQINEPGLDGIANLVGEDVYNNLKVLEYLSPLVKSGGYISWACVDAGSNGSFSQASAAFDTVLQASLQHVAKINDCEPVWVGRRDTVQQTARDMVDTLLNSTCQNNDARFSFRYAVLKIGGYICRWLKIIT